MDLLKWLDEQKLQMEICDYVAGGLTLSLKSENGAKIFLLIDQFIGYSPVSGIGSNLSETLKDLYGKLLTHKKIYCYKKGKWMSNMEVPNDLTLSNIYYNTKATLYFWFM